jgi:hypothetical protein
MLAAVPQGWYQRAILVGVVLHEIAIYIPLPISPVHPVVLPFDMGCRFPGHVVKGVFGAVFLSAAV